MTDDVANPVAEDPDDIALCLKEHKRERQIFFDQRRCWACGFVIPASKALYLWRISEGDYILSCTRDRKFVEGFYTTDGKYDEGYLQHFTRERLDAGGTHADDRQPPQ